MYSTNRYAKICGFVLFVASVFFSGFLVIRACVQGRSLYLYPALINMKAFLPDVVIGAILLLLGGFLTVLIVRTCTRRLWITKLIALILCCLGFAVNGLVLSFGLSIGFESRTIDLDHYLIFDSKSGTISEIDDFFPEKELLSSFGVVADYSYRYSVPVLCDTYVYDVVLNVSYEDQQLFDAELSRLSEIDGATSENDRITLTLKEETIEGADDVSVVHKITADKSARTVTYSATRSLVR